MRTIRIAKGLDLPISGGAKQEIGDGPPISQVAILGPDYVGMKPTMEVAAGDRVETGQVLFSDKATPGVRFTSPGCGEVAAVNRGAKRALQSVVVRLDGEQSQAYASFLESDLTGLDPEKVCANLVRSGLWTALRTRPFSRIPSPESTPGSIFVTAIDTHPLAADPNVIIAERTEDFVNGLKVLSRIAPGKKVYVCTGPGLTISAGEIDGVERVEFSGPHPAGLPGTHIHFLDPADRHHVAWHVNYQDVMAMGRFFVTGYLDVERVVSLAGPGVTRPRLIRTRLGADLNELTAGELTEGDNRVVSGSVLSGRTAHGPLAFLGRYHLQVSALAEGHDRELFGWMAPGFNKYSLKNVFASKLLLGKKFDMTTAAYSGARAIVPIGSYEQVMPLDILPTFLLRALEVDDVEQAEALGCLELDEDDLALCTFACPGKQDYGAMLRRNLTTIEKEG